jgi:hypothetical protein
LRPVALDREDLSKNADARRLYRLMNEVPY